MCIAGIYTHFGVCPPVRRHRLLISFVLPVLVLNVVGFACEILPTQKKLPPGIGRNLISIRSILVSVCVWTRRWVGAAAVTCVQFNCMLAVWPCRWPVRSSRWRQQRKYILCSEVVAVIVVAVDKNVRTCVNTLADKTCVLSTHMMDYLTISDHTHTLHA